MPFAYTGAIDAARVSIRLIDAAHLPALMAVNGDDDVTRYLPYASWQTPADAEAWLSRMTIAIDAGHTLQYAIVDKASGVAIGSCLLFRLEAASARAELGYVLGRAHWNQGLMREALVALLDHAFGPMSLRRIECEIDPRNLPSLQLCERLGFTREGLLRQRWIAKGSARDVHVYGLLRDEWPAARRQPNTA